MARLLKIFFLSGLILLQTALLGQSRVETPPLSKNSQADLSALMALIQQTPVKKEWQGANYVVLLHSTDVVVEASGLSHVNFHQVIKILTPKGGALFCAQRFDYDPMSSFVRVDRIRIIRKNGQVQNVSLTGIIDLPQPQHLIYWGPRMKLAAIPKLYPGDVLELKYYRKGFVIAYLNPSNPNRPQGKTAANQSEEQYVPPMRGHFYDVVYFIDWVPVAHKKYSLKVPRNKPVQYRIFNGDVRSATSFTKTHFVYHFEKRDIAAFRKEPRMSAYGDIIEDFSDSLPKLVLATVPNWQAKSRWFYRTNEPVFKFNPEILKKVTEITRGLQTDKEKATALLHWVADNIRYVGITMGKGEGYTIHPGIMTFNDRAGVCKDIAGMLITMLRAAKFTVYPAMTMAGSRVEDIPADQFNHCVVAMKLKDGSYWMLDPTWAPFSREIWSSAEQLQNYVIGDPVGQKLSITPYVPPQRNLITITADSRIDSNGNLESRVQIRADGFSDARIRRLFANTPVQLHQRLFEKIAGKVSPFAKLVSSRISRLDDYTRPIQIDYEYRIAEYATQSDRVLYFSPTLPKNILLKLEERLFDYYDLGQPGQRKYQVFLKCTWGLLFKETIRVPKGYRLIALPKAKTIDSEVARFRYQIRAKGQEIQVEEEFLVKKRVFPPHFYSRFAEAVNALKSFPENKVLLAK